jgi:hypothetical protein
MAFRRLLYRFSGSNKPVSEKNPNAVRDPQFLRLKSAFDR